MESLPENLKRYPNRSGRDALAARLGLTIDPFSQDWEWEVAKPEKFQTWLAVYRFEPLSDGERLSLMEMLIQCVESLARLRGVDAQVGEFPEWQAVDDLLRANSRLHASTIEYWALPEADDDPDHQFRVTGSMRRLWATVQSMLSEPGAAADRGSL